jgi:NAD(P)-dependent dehydrogenase (short-subunit alcohol dehydrogenase family)
MAVYPELRGRSAAITGAARGIGFEVAASMAKSGMNILLIDVDEGALVDARYEVAQRHPDVRVETAVASVSDRSAVAHTLADFASAVGPLDVLVNNAGVAANAPSLDLDLDAWQRALEVNLTGTFVCSQVAGCIMTQQGHGVIINIASMYGLVAAPERAAYCASKAGVASLTKVLAVEWAHRGIRVNAVGPGYVETDLISQLVAQDRLDLAALRRRTPSGRLGSPEDMANLVLFLASDVSQNITGQVIASDGGWTADGYGIVPFG